VAVTDSRCRPPSLNTSLESRTASSMGPAMHLSAACRPSFKLLPCGVMLPCVAAFPPITQAGPSVTAVTVPDRYPKLEDATSERVHMSGATP
jgi:hypothetical protein